MGGTGQETTPFSSQNPGLSSVDGANLVQDAQLARLVEAWPTLPEATRNAIVAMLDGAAAQRR